MNLEQFGPRRLLVPLGVGLVCDVWVVGQFSPERWSASLVGELALYGVAHACGVLSLAWLLDLFVLSAFRRQRWVGLTALCCGIFAWEFLAQSPSVTPHWTLAKLRIVAVVATIAIVGASLKWRWVPGKLRTPVLVGCVASVSFLCLAAGTSLLPITPKYLRDTIHTGIIYGMAAVWLVETLARAEEYKGRLNWRKVVPWVVASQVFAAGLDLVSSERSRWVVASNSAFVRSLRRCDRAVARLVVGELFRSPRNIVGYTRPAVRAVTGAAQRPVSCRNRPGKAGARSALLLTVDALRADFYGVDTSRLPNFQRLRAESIEYTAAHQTSSGTSLSIFSFWSGRYPGVETPVLDVRPSLAQIGFVMKEPEPPGGPAIPDARQTDRLISQMKDGSAGGGRFVEHVHYMTLHLPAGMNRTSHSYVDSLLEADRELGRVLDFLENSGLSDETVLVVTADHGEELRGERGFESHGYGATESLLHTPLFVRAPGVDASSNGELVSGVDVLPTILDVLNVECGYPLHGRSLLLRGHTERPVFGSGLFQSPALPDSPVYSDIHAAYLGKWKLLYDRGENALALYNWRADPQERTNLADDESARVRELWPHLGGYLDGNYPGK